MLIWEELKRRKVIQVATTYAVVGWLLITIVTQIQPWLPLLPVWFPTLVIILLTIGFPIALIFAWVFDIGPQGVHRESPAADNRQKGLSSGPFYISQVIIIALVGFLIVDQYLLDGSDRREGIPVVQDLSYRVFPLTLVKNDPVASSRWGEFSLSRTGSHLVYKSEAGIYLWDFKDEPRLIPGSNDIFAAPFLSPDGQYVAYWSTRGGLAKLPVSGGRSEEITTVIGGMNSAHWATDGYIYLSNEDWGIRRVPEDGGTFEAVIPPESTIRFHGPWLLPDDDTLIYSAAERSARWDEAEIIAYSMSKESTTALGIKGSDVRYVESGHLVFAVGESLYGIAFDPETLETSGPPFELVSDLTLSTAVGSADYGVSDDGIFAYISRRAEQRRRLIWVDRSDNRIDIDIEPGNYWYVQLSPDDTEVVLNGWDDQERIVWTGGFEGNVLPLSIQQELSAATGVWSLDGDFIAYTRSLEDGTNEIVARRKDRSGVFDVLYTLDSSLYLIPTAYVPGQRTLLATRAGPPRSTYEISLDDPNAEPVLLLGDGRRSYYNASVSPNGQWIVYQSDKSGQLEIYVRRYRDGTGDTETQISRNGGVHPAWRRDDGSELFFLEPTDEPGIFNLMSFPVDLVSGEPPFNGLATPILTDRFFVAFSTFRNPYDVSIDGSRFILLQDAPTDDVLGVTSEIVVALNWTTRLAEIVPSAQQGP